MVASAASEPAAEAMALSFAESLCCSRRGDVRDFFAGEDERLDSACFGDFDLSFRRLEPDRSRSPLDDRGFRFDRERRGGDLDRLRDDTERRRGDGDRRLFGDERRLRREAELELSRAMM